MSTALSKTLKDKDMDRIFAEVPCTESLGLRKPGQLRLFHLLIRDDKFYHEDLERWLYRNLSRYNIVNRKFTICNTRESYIRLRSGECQEAMTETRTCGRRQFPGTGKAGPR